MLVCDMKQKIAEYQQAHQTLVLAEQKLEELRSASVPYRSKRVETAWDEEGRAMNWHNVFTKDKIILKSFKQFRSQVGIVSQLAQKANIARRKMIEQIHQQVEGDLI